MPRGCDRAAIVLRLCCDDVAMAVRDSSTRQQCATAVRDRGVRVRQHTLIKS